MQTVVAATPIPQPLQSFAPPPNPIQPVQSFAPPPQPVVQSYAPPQQVQSFVQPQPVQSFAPPPQVATTSIPVSTLSQAQPQQERKRGLRGLFGKRKENSQLEIKDISGPTGFRHESHIGWDSEHGFEV